MPLHPLEHTVPPDFVDAMREHQAARRMLRISYLPAAAGTAMAIATLALPDTPASTGWIDAAIAALFVGWTVWWAASTRQSTTFDGMLRLARAYGIAPNRGESVQIWAARVAREAAEDEVRHQWRRVALRPVAADEPGSWVRRQAALTFARLRDAVDAMTLFAAHDVIAAFDQSDGQYRVLIATSTPAGRAADHALALEWVVKRIGNSLRRTADLADGEADPQTEPADLPVRTTDLDALPDWLAQVDLGDPDLASHLREDVLPGLAGHTMQARALVDLLATGLTAHPASLRDTVRVRAYAHLPVYLLALLPDPDELEHALRRWLLTSRRDGRTTSFDQTWLTGTLPAQPEKPPVG